MNTDTDTDTDSHPAGAFPDTSEALAEEAAAWFVRLRGDGVEAAERARFAAWLAASPDHRRAYGEVAALWQAPGLERALAETPLSGGLAARRYRPARPRLRPARALAAALAALALGLRFAAPGCLGADYCAAVGETRRVVLADGSQVTLNTGSALRLEAEAGLRRVRLVRGEAFFEVRRDPARPFLVDARRSQVRVKGTRFLVREDENADTVAVVEGLVEVGRGGAGEVLLRAGDQVVVDAQGVGGVHKARQPAAWLGGKLLFDDAPLAEVAAEIARYRRGAVLVQGGRLESLRVSGRFDIADTDRALESLAQTLPVTIYRLTPWLVLIAQAAAPPGGKNFPAG